MPITKKMPPPNKPRTAGNKSGEGRGNNNDPEKKPK